MRTLLAICDFLDFLTSPAGITTSFWLTVYFFLLHVLHYDIGFAIFISAIPSLDLYMLLKEAGH